MKKNKRKTNYHQKKNQTNTEIKQKMNIMRKTKHIILSTENSPFLFSYKTIDVNAVNTFGINLYGQLFGIRKPAKKKKVTIHLIAEEKLSFLIIIQSLSICTFNNFGDYFNRIYVVTYLLYPKP